MNNVFNAILQLISKTPSIAKNVLEYCLNNANGIILLILAIGTIRDAIAVLGLYPREWRGSWLIYGKYDRNLIKMVLKEELHYSDQDADQFVRGMTAKEQKRNRERDSKVYYRMLIDVIRSCMIEGKAIYGSTLTEYYIHTMMGSQDDRIRDSMSELLVHMILNELKKQRIDYIIVPKSGNSRLGQAVAEKLNARCILHKSKNDNAYAKPEESSDDRYRINYNINFEGAHYLPQNGKKTIRGIVMDCNTSGGSQLLAAVEEFNAIIEHMPLQKFEPITDIFVLFRADQDDGVEIDAEFEARGCKLHRIFDLTEQFKGRIFDGISEDERITYYGAESKVDGIIADMRDAHLLHLDSSEYTRKQKTDIPEEVEDSMNKQWRLVRDFQRKFHHPTSDSPCQMTPERVSVREKWMKEEIQEFHDAQNMYQQADAMIDLMYFALGTLVEMGIKPDEIFDIVHKANMAKLWPDGPHYDKNGKTVKPIGWEDPEPLIRVAIDRMGQK